MSWIAYNEYTARTEEQLATYKQRADEWMRGNLAALLERYVGDGRLYTCRVEACPHCDYVHAVWFGTDDGYSTINECIRCGACWCSIDEVDV